jgi:hypothetical protein
MLQEWILTGKKITIINNSIKWQTDQISKQLKWGYQITIGFQQTQNLDKMLTKLVIKILSQVAMWVMSMKIQKLNNQCNKNKCQISNSR